MDPDDDEQQQIIQNHPTTGKKNIEHTVISISDDRIKGRSKLIGLVDDFLSIEIVILPT